MSIDDKALKQKSFLADRPPANPSIRPEILASWERSRNAGVDPDALILPTYLAKEKTTAFITEEWTFQREQIWKFLEKFYDLLDKKNSAIFHTTPDLTIFNHRGNQQLLEKVNSFNLGIGTNLSESLVGTNAAALVAQTHQESYVNGAEHYLRVLQDYTTLAVEMPKLDDSLCGYFVLITPKNSYNDYWLLLLDFVHNLGRYYLHFLWDNSERVMMNELLYQNAEQQNRGMIFVDQNGFIIKTNPWVDSNLRQGGRGQKFADVFPELSEAVKCFKTKTPLPLHEVFINEPLRQNMSNVFMECRPIKKETQIIGMVVTLVDKKVLYKHAAELSNFHTRFNFDDLIGTSPNFAAAKRSAMSASHFLSNILIIGESGTGKELFAQAIHNASSRKNGPFISINCAAIPKELIGSELFGYTEGAYTGARKGGAPGKFELANNGTIFLDEIGEMPYDMQAVLLRVLEERMVTRIGGSHQIPVNVKIISATNKNLWESVTAKQFRLDLYYRLNVIKIEIPPFRERLNDLEQLIDFYLKQFNNSLNKNITGVSPEVIQLFRNYYWPGNVRELRNVLERGVTLSEFDLITVNDLPSEMRGSYLTYPAPDLPAHSDSSALSEQLIKKYEKKISEKKKIMELLEKYNGNKTRVAQELGITRVTLYKKLQY